MDEGCNAACRSASWAARGERYFDMFGFQSEYREDTRTKVFTGPGGNTVAAVGRCKFPFALAFTSERGGIHHLSGTIESWELPGDGPFLHPIDAQAQVRSDQGLAKSSIFIENKPGFYLRMYKDAKTGLMLINVADFDLLNDQALTPQLLRASRPCTPWQRQYHLQPVSLVERLPAESTSTFFARWCLCLETTRCVSRTWQLDSTSWTNILIPMVIFAATSVSDIVDELATSLSEIEKIAKCWSRLCVDDSPEEVHQSNIVLIDCRAFRDPASSALRNHWRVHPTTLSKILNHHKFPGLLLDFVELVIRFADKDPQTRKTDLFHLQESPPSFSRMQLSHASHPHCTQLLSEYAHNSNCFAWTSLVQS